MQKPEDRQLIEELLRTGEFNTRQYPKLRSAGENCNGFVASSQARDAGERILAKWDVRVQTGWTRGSLTFEERNERKYNYLGNASGTITLMTHPRTTDGSLWLYLIPETVPTKRWADSKPIHRMRMAFGDYRPGREIGNKVAFHFMLGNLVKEVGRGRQPARDPVARPAVQLVDEPVGLSVLSLRLGIEDIAGMNDDLAYNGARAFQFLVVRKLGGPGREDRGHDEHCGAGETTMEKVAIQYRAFVHRLPTLQYVNCEPVGEGVVSRN